MLTTHLARVDHLDETPTRRPGLTRWDVLLDLGHHHALVGSRYLSASTIDPFAAETCRLARETEQRVWVEVRKGAYGYDVISVEGDADGQA